MRCGPMAFSGLQYPNGTKTLSMPSTIPMRVRLTPAVLELLKAAAKTRRWFAGRDAVTYTMAKDCQRHSP